MLIIVYYTYYVDVDCRYVIILFISYVFLIYIVHFNLCTN